MKRHLLLFFLSASASLAQGITESGTAANFSSIMTTTVHQHSYVTDDFFKGIINQFEKSCLGISECVTAATGFPVVLVYVTPLDCTPLQPIATKVNAPDTYSKENAKDKTRSGNPNSSPKTVCDASLCHLIQTTQSYSKAQSSGSPKENKGNLGGAKDEKTTTMKRTLVRTRTLCNSGSCQMLTYTTEIPTSSTTNCDALTTTTKSSCLLGACQNVTITSTIPSNDVGLGRSCSGCQIIQPVFDEAAPITTTLFTTVNFLSPTFMSLDGRVAENGLNILFTETTVNGGTSILPSSWSLSVDSESNKQIVSKANHLLSLKSAGGHQAMSVSTKTSFEPSAQAAATPLLVSSTTTSTLPTESSNIAIIINGDEASNLNYPLRSKANVYSRPTEANIYKIDAASTSTDSSFKLEDFEGVSGSDVHRYQDTTVSHTKVYRLEGASIATNSGNFKENDKAEATEAHKDISDSTTYPDHVGFRSGSGSFDVQKLLTMSEFADVNKPLFKNVTYPYSTLSNKHGHSPSQLALSFQSSAGDYNKSERHSSPSTSIMSIGLTTERKKLPNELSDPHMSIALVSKVSGAQISSTSSAQYLYLGQSASNIQKHGPKTTTDSQSNLTISDPFTSSAILATINTITSGSSQISLDARSSQSLIGKSQSQSQSQGFLNIKSISTSSSNKWTTRTSSSYERTSKSSTTSASSSLKTSHSTSKALKPTSKTVSLKQRVKPSKKPARQTSKQTLVTLGAPDSARFSSSYVLQISSPQAHSLTSSSFSRSSRSSLFSHSGFKNGTQPKITGTSHDSSMGHSSFSKPSSVSKSQTAPLSGLSITTGRLSTHHSPSLTAYRQSTFSSVIQSLSGNRTASQNSTTESSLTSLVAVSSVGSMSAVSMASSASVNNSTLSTSMVSANETGKSSSLRSSSSSLSLNSTSKKLHTASASSLTNSTDFQDSTVPNSNNSDLGSAFLISFSRTSIKSGNSTKTGFKSQNATVSFDLNSQSLKTTTKSSSRGLSNASLTSYTSPYTSQIPSPSTKQRNGTVSGRLLSLALTGSSLGKSSLTIPTKISLNMTNASPSKSRTASSLQSFYSSRNVSFSITSLNTNSSNKAPQVTRPSYSLSNYEVSAATISNNSPDSKSQNSTSLRSNNSTYRGPNNSLISRPSKSTSLSPNNSSSLKPSNFTSMSLNNTAHSGLQDYTSLSPHNSLSFSAPSFNNKTLGHSSIKATGTSLHLNNATSMSASLASKYSTSLSIATRHSSISILKTHQNSTTFSKIKPLSASSHSSSRSSTVKSNASVSASSKSPPSASSSKQQKASDPARIIVSEPRDIAVPDLFKEIDNVDPGTLFTKRDLPLAKPENVKNNDLPIQTNKFYGNLLVGNQNHVTFTHPYSFYWDGTKHFGYGAQVTRADKVVQGPLSNTGGTRYFYNPVFMPDIIFSATSIDAKHSHLTVTHPRSMSVKVNISPEKDMGANYIEMPLVQGMGMVSAIYHGNLVPRLATSGSIKSFVSEGIAYYTPRTTTYRVKYSSGNEWLIFVTVPTAGVPFLLSVQGNQIVGSGSIDGLIIQAAPAAGGEEAGNLDGFYHQSAGKYLIDAQLSGNAGGSNASYSINYFSEGSSMFQTPLVFALPHHLETLDPSIKTKFTGIQLPSATKGMMNLFLTPELKFNEKLNLDVQWNPWVEGMGTSISYTGDQVKQICQTAVSEISDHDIKSTILSNDNGYFRGKALDKYAQILYVLNDIVQDNTLTQQLLDVMQSTFDDLRDGKVKFPLNFDKTWGGVTSSSAHGHLWDEFGSGLYNDHHFHYGYYVHAAAIMARVDKSGEFLRKNKDWINALVKDVANPRNDGNFPESRLFDWYNGHSWAKGLFESQDSKDQESTSEDYHFSYAMKLWGQVTDNPAMELRGDLMLQIQKRAMNLYYLLADDNEVMYPFLRKNKVAGILFENKVDYTTYFGTNREYIHGINMLPITPASGIVRGKKFVKEEWEQLLKDLKVEDGWAGILQMNRALYDGQSAYEFFSSPSFDKKYLDGGQSRTWALAYTAAIANAEKATESVPST